MKPIHSKVDTNSEEFAGNVEFMTDYVARIRHIESQIRKGEERYRERATKAGKLLPRERLAHLLDPGTPFLELNSIAGYQMLGDTDGTISGTSEYLAENDADGIRLAREVIDQLPPDAGRALTRDKEPEEPIYDREELLGIVPSDKRVPYDMKEIIARIADGSRFLEFKSEFGSDTVCGHFYLDGWRCGVITNNGPITPQGAIKSAHFLQLCDQSNTPMIFLHNTTGFLVGLEAEQGGQVKHGSKMIQAVMNFRPPKITIIVGNSYGAGNYAMCSKSLKPVFSFSWPTARTAVMGGAQAAKVLSIVAEARFKSKGQEMDEATKAMLTEQSEKIEAGMEISSEAIYTSSRMMDDGLIDPRDTRQVISFCLETCKETPHRDTEPNTFGVLRL